MITRTVLGVLFIIIFTLTSSSPTFATDSRNRTDGEGIITFQGNIITKEELSHLMDTRSIHCHDALGEAFVRCFSTNMQAETDLQQLGVHITIGNNSAVDSPVTNTVTPYSSPGCAYITLYDEPDLTGSSYTLCTNRRKLSEIGWDNRTESLKTYSSEAMVFENEDFEGSGARIAPNQTVDLLNAPPWVVDTFYQNISSVGEVFL